MADNINVTPGTGAIVAADEIGGVLFQRVKTTFGVDGAATDVSPTSPLPVQLPQLTTAAVGQVTVGTSATQILAADTSSKYREIKNTGTATMFVGGASVTASSGYPLLASESMTIIWTAAVFGVVASGTAVVGTLTVA